MAGKGEVGIVYCIHRLRSASCNYPQEPNHASMTLLHLHPPYASSSLAFFGFIFLVVYIDIRQWFFFPVRFDLVAHMLLPCMVWAALALSSPVADQQSQELGKSEEVGESYVWLWMNKFPGGHKGQVNLMARSPVHLWVRVR